MYLYSRKQNIKTRHLIVKRTKRINFSNGNEFSHGFPYPSKQTRHNININERESPKLNSNVEKML